MPTLHSIILYNMTRLGCDATNFGVFLFVTILMSNAAYSLGKTKFYSCFVYWDSIKIIDHQLKLKCIKQRLNIKILNY